MALFWCSCSIFTVIPCDECSFRVRLYATSKEHSLPDINDILDDSRCLADFNARKKWRVKFPGACVTEYESIMQVVINILIGWKQEESKGTNGIFGIPQAYADCCEEQARYTLHSHISVWIKDFNDVRNMIFHENEDLRKLAIQEIETYVHIIAQATLGGLYEIIDGSSQKPSTLKNSMMP